MVRTFRNQVFWQEILPFNLVLEGSHLHLPDADFKLPEPEGAWATPQHSQLLTTCFLVLKLHSYALVDSACTSAPPRPACHGACRGCPGC
jgi:hypothetical protein